MASGKAEIRGHQSVVDALLVPRPLTRLLMLVIALLIGELLWRVFSVKLLAYVSGLAAPFCLLCAGAVWGMRDKASDALSGETLSASKYERARSAAAVLRTRIKWRAAFVAVCSLAAISPAVSNQLVGPVWHGMVLIGAVGVSEAAYSYLIAAAWEDELLAFRDRQVRDEKERVERDALIARIEASGRGGVNKAPAPG